MDTQDSVEKVKRDLSSLLGTREGRLVRKLVQLKQHYYDDGDVSGSGSVSSCHMNCSGNGECRNGYCHCMIRYEGEECKHINVSYHMAFASIFYLLALTSLIQLGMCIHAEYLRMKKAPSIFKACRVTTQKFLYFLVFLASVLRGTYFAVPTVGSEVSTSLLSAYYPVVLTSASLLVCFWAEIFHLREIRWDRPRFLSKSFLGFLAFNIVSYSLLLAELLLVWMPSEGNVVEDLLPNGRRIETTGGADVVRREFYAHVFNGCYAFLMFVVVIFFLIYGVEVFFNVRGGFTVPRVPKVIGANATGVDEQQRRLLRRQMRRRRRQRELDDAKTEELKDLTPKRPPSSGENEELTVTEEIYQAIVENPSQMSVTNEMKAANNVAAPVVGISGTASNNQIPKFCEHNDPMINTSQLHQSRLGLLSQAFMMMITVGFLFSETLEQFWKTKVNLTSRNTYDILFRVLEIGVALWFPCVLWNCIRPDQLWCLNPKKILDESLKPRLKKSSDAKEGGTYSSTPETTTDEDDEKGPECWICYDMDRTDAGAMICPCDCRGDVAAVHHDCLRRWLVESADNPEALKCKVCSATYMVEKGSQFSLANGFTPLQWLQTASLITAMCLAVGGAWTVIQLYSQPWIRSLAVGMATLILYISLRSLGLNTLNAYQRAKVSALKIVNLRIRGQNRSSAAAKDHRNVGSVQVELVNIAPMPDISGDSLSVTLGGISCPETRISSS